MRCNVWFYFFGRRVKLGVKFMNFVLTSDKTNRSKYLHVIVVDIIYGKSFFTEEKMNQHNVGINKVYVVSIC